MGEVKAPFLAKKKAMTCHEWGFLFLPRKFTFLNESKRTTADANHKYSSFFGLSDCTECEFPQYLPTSWPLSAAQLLIHFLNVTNSYPTAAASSSSDQIGLGNLAVDANTFEGGLWVLLILFWTHYESLYLYLATRWYSVRRTKLSQMLLSDGMTPLAR